MHPELFLHLRSLTLETDQKGTSCRNCAKTPNLNLMYTRKTIVELFPCVDRLGKSVIMLTNQCYEHLFAPSYMTTQPNAPFRKIMIVIEAIYMY